MPIIALFLIALAAGLLIGLAFDRQGDLYATDVAGPVQSVRVFGPDGKYVRTIDDYGVGLRPHRAKGSVALSNAVQGCEG